jgi:S-adenosylmethionine uptake transporter
MAAIWMLAAMLLFSLMGVCVKFASAQYNFFELVGYRGLISLVVIGLLTQVHGVSLRTPVPLAHTWRSVVGVSSLCLWFYSFAGLPLATAVTLNATAPVWIALILMSAAFVLTARKADWRLTLAIIISFAGVALVLKPTITQDQLHYGFMGLLSGLLAAFAYLQVAQLGRMGEPEYRVVFYFSLGCMIGGLAGALAMGYNTQHTWQGIGLLLAIGLLACMAQMAMTRAYTVGKTLVIANMQYSGIVFSSFFGWLFFSDRVDWLAWLGIALIIVSGIAATIYRPKIDAPDTSIGV